MKQYFIIIRIRTSMDMGIGNRCEDWAHIDIDELLPGKEFVIHECPLSILSVDEEWLNFTYRKHVYRLNRRWQVLGTPEIGVTNEYIAEQLRYVFHCGNIRSCNHEWDITNAERLYREILDNAGKGLLWKNIPLVRDFIHELKDNAPFRNYQENPAGKACILQNLLKEKVLDMREAPRLYQSMCELYRFYLDFMIPKDFDEDLRSNYDRYFFREVDQLIYRYAWIMDNPKSELAKDCWDRLGGMLKVDPVQALPEWEEVIYDVELELEEELKDEPRGMGFCYGYWSAKRAALARRGIEWNPPPSMNPGVMFD
ncbi:MAG: hypothetical protein IKT87_03250 [Bacteroidaceae bacterium]|nr:hypothetical protein [Bacteroidaceae bacterium]